MTRMTLPAALMVVLFSGFSFSFADSEPIEYPKLSPGRFTLVPGFEFQPSRPETPRACDVVTDLEILEENRILMSDRHFGACPAEVIVPENRREYVVSFALGGQCAMYFELRSPNPGAILPLEVKDFRNAASRCFGWGDDLPAETVSDILLNEFMPGDEMPKTYVSLECAGCIAPE